MGKLQVIKFEQNLCNAKIDDNSVLFVRVSGLVTDKKAIVEVPFTHDAIIIKGGGDCRYYKSGNYPVFDNRTEVKDWKRGLSVDVIYIPKDTQVLINWGTPNRVEYRDEASGKVITVGAYGEFDVSVHNPEQFFRKVVGVKKEFNLDEFSRRYSETVASEFADIFLRAVADLHLTYDQFSANKKEISKRMGEILSPMFEEEWGLSVRHFNIAGFDLKDSDKNAIEDAAAEVKREAKRKQEEEEHRQKLKEYLAEVERLDDKQWEREKYLRQLELQDNAAYYEVLKVMGDKPVAAQKPVCPQCGNPYEPSAAFCPSCGARVSKQPLKCPDCGKVNDPTAKFCSGCGKKLL